MLPNKSIKIVCNYLLGPLLFGWLLFSIVQQVGKQVHLGQAWQQVQQSFRSARLWYLAAATVLVAANWGLEARKWQLSVSVMHPVGFGKACKAVLSGVSFAVSTPNRVGEYLGRMLYLPDGTRLQSIAITIVGSIGQLLVTLYAGLMALTVLQPWLMRSGFFTPLVYRAVCWCTVLAAFVLTLLYCESGFIGRLLDRLLGGTRYRYLTAALRQCSRALLGKLFLLSLLRYLVFIAQYLLLFAFFGVDADPWLLAQVLGLLFLAMAAIPSIALADIGLRGQLSLALVGMIAANDLGVALTTAVVWLLNLVLPALAGSVLILSIRWNLQTSKADEIMLPVTVADAVQRPDTAGGPGG